MPNFMCHRHFILAALLTVAACSARIEAQTYTDLFDFSGAADGCCQIHPGNLAQGRDGNIYGTTNSGGVHLVGAVFKMTPTDTLTLLHSFNSTDGSSPRGGLSLGLDGNFYGTTVQGGTSSGGTIFQITPSGTFKTLYSFTNGTDGAFPFTPPVPGPDGNLYGVTGNSTNHVFYRITTARGFHSTDHTALSD